MKILIDFPGGSRVDAHFDGFNVETDQPPDAKAPTPFEIFLASIGACAGIYVLGFCRQHNLPTDEICIIEHSYTGANEMVEKIDLKIRLPTAFPEKYRAALIRSAELCKVKKHLEKPPKFEITTTRLADSA